MTQTLADKLSNRLADFYFLVCAAMLVLLSYVTPLDSWDLLGHLGAAFALTETDPTVIHERAYAEAALHMSADKYESLVSDFDFRQTWADDPESFNQLLPFYAPRILITGLASAADSLGLSPLLALRAQSSLAGGLGMLLLMLAFKPWVPRAAWILLPVVALFGGVLEISRFEGSDALMFLAFAAFALLFLRQSLWCILFIALLPLTRSDAIILSVVLMPLCILAFPDRRIWTIVATLVAVFFYFLINRLFENYGWAVQFYVVHVEYLEYPAAAQVSISVGDYIRAVIHSIRPLFYNKLFLAAVTVSFLLLLASFDYLKNCKSRAIGMLENPCWRLHGLALASILFIVLHYIAFPHILTRYFAGQYLVLLFCALALFGLRREGALPTNEKE